MRRSGVGYLTWLAVLALVAALNPARAGQSAPNSWPASAPGGAGLFQSGGTVVEAVVSDPQNKLAWCNDENARVPFGDKQSDKGRCMTFRYQIPPGGINGATLHLAIEPLGGLQDTDATAVAVGKPFDYCNWGQGNMAGCVVLHGGFIANEPSLDVDLFNLKCDPAVPDLNPDKQQAVIDQVRTGTLHVLLEDDTAVHRAQLVLNGPPLASCGQSNRPGTPGVAPGGNGGSTGGTTGGSTTTGTSFPPPTFGSPEPANVRAMTLQAGQRRVIAGQLTQVPVWLINGADIANMNFTVTYDGGVVQTEGNLAQGYIVDSALFSGNLNERGIVRGGFAQTSGLGGTGIVAYIPFRAVGRAGAKTTLHVDVSTINNPGGTNLAIDRIDGSVEIVGPDGMVQGDCDGDGFLTALDARCALEISVNLRPAISSLDLDHNGSVTSRDATLILQQARPIR